MMVRLCNRYTPCLLDERGSATSRRPPALPLLVPQTDALRHWCTWHCCLRYLRARKARRALLPHPASSLLFLPLAPGENRCVPMSVRSDLAAQWKYDKALEMLRKSVEWRREVQPESIRWDDLPEQMVTGKIIVPRSGDVCLQGRPILLMEMRRNESDPVKDVQAQVKHLIYWMEVASRAADALPKVRPAWPARSCKPRPPVMHTWCMESRPKLARRLAHR